MVLVGELEMNGLCKKVVLLLVAWVIFGLPSVSLAGSWQKPRKDKETIQERPKPAPDNKDKGSDRKPKDDQKKKDDNLKKPYF